VDYELSQHARTVLAERGIPVPWLEQALKTPAKTHPDAEDPEVEHRLARIEENGGRVLRVVVNVTTKPPPVITAYFDRSLRHHP